MLRDMPLPVESCVHVDIVYCAFPDELGWLAVTRMFVLHGQVFDVRV